jgi:hypothetical protein
VPLAATSGLRILALKQTKIKMNKTMERAETDRLWPIIETLNWVLNEILVACVPLEDDCAMLEKRMSGDSCNESRLSICLFPRECGSSSIHFLHCRM